MRESLKTAKESPDNGGKGLVRETLNAIRLLTRLTPLLYEDTEWIGFYHSKIPAGDGDGIEARTLAEDVIEVFIFFLFTLLTLLDLNRAFIYTGNGRTSFSNNGWIILR